jgi:glutaredoxin
MSLFGQRGRVTVVTKLGCVYCDRAKEWLDEKEVAYEAAQYELMDDVQKAELKLEVGGDKLTFPQIFIGAHRVAGGCTGLTAMSTFEFECLLVTQGIFS